MQEEIFNMLMKEDDITWHEILTDLVKSEKMDPWDIDVSTLTKKYIDMLKKLKELDLKVSGKVILCAALLLKMKSTRLVGSDLQRLDELFYPPEEDDLYSDDDYDQWAYAKDVVKGGKIKLLPRTPQPRKRKVSIYDLMEALQKAMEVKRRRVMRNVPEELEIRLPAKQIDISVVIREVFSRIKSWFFKNNKKIKFSQLIPGSSKEDKVYTFIPLLHLSNQRKIEISQEEHFGDIDIELSKNPPKKEVEDNVNEDSSEKSDGESKDVIKNKDDKINFKD
ncbi:MAG: ScpA family protein [Nanoarchaeota archaeon]|nr:ScpA family protein [Nanoarchaeota archaeon]